MKLKIIFFFLIVFNSCEPTVKNQLLHTDTSNMNESHTLKVFPATTTISSILRLEWGKDIPNFLVDAPSFGGSLSNNYKIRSEIRFKITYENYKVLLFPNNTLVVFNANNQLLSSFDISPHFENAKNWKIVDFMVDQFGNKYLIEQYKLNQNPKYIYITRKFDFNNTLLGVINNNIAGNSILIPHNKEMYILSSLKDNTVLLSIDFYTKKLEIIHTFPFLAKHAFVGDEPTLCLINSTNKADYKLIKYNVQTTQTISYFVNRQAGVPIGLDKKDNYYSARGRQFKCLDLNTKDLREEKIFNLVFDETQKKYYLSFLNSANSKMSIVSTNENYTFSIPINVNTSNSAAYQLSNSYLMNVDYPVFLFQSFVPETREKILVSYDLAQDKFIEISSDFQDFPSKTFHLQSPISWQIKEGSAYIPVLGDKYFYIFELSL